MRSGIEVVIKFCWGIKTFRSVFGALLMCGCGFLCTQTVYGASITLTVANSVTANVVQSSGGVTISTSPIDQPTITIRTDNRTGYTLSLKSSSNSVPALKLNGTDDNKKIDSIAEQKEAISFFTDNTWGYKPTKKNGDNWEPLAVKRGNETPFTAGYFLPGPTNVGDVLATTTVANSANDEYNITIATKVGENTTSGIYKNSFTVAAIANEIPKRTVNITVNNSSYGTVATSSGSNPVIAEYGSDIRTNDNILTIGSEIVTATPNSGYTFDNWESNCGDTLTDNCTITANFKIADSWQGITTMQQMTGEICGAVPTPSASDTNPPSAQLKDTRDNKLYWVTKLADGNCWMTQNLDFNISTTNVKSTDSDVSTDWTTSSTYKPVATLTDASSYTGDAGTAVQSWDPGNYYWDGTFSTRCDAGKTTYSGCTGFSTSGNAHYHVGNLYSWNAATAGSGGTITSGQASSSICPKGWRLPMSSDNPSFANLQTAGSLGDTVSKWTSAPYYFTRTGSLQYDSYKLYYAGDSGVFWSSTPRSDSANYARHLYFGDSSSVGPANGGSPRYTANSVRCVAKNPVTTYTVTYNANGGSGGPGTKTYTVEGSTVSLESSNKPTRSNYTFQGWSTNSSATSGSYEYTFPSGSTSVTLYAAWKSSGSSCLIAGTPVNLPDGTTKPIEELADWEEAVAWDFDNGKAVGSLVTPIDKDTTPREYNVVYLNFSDGKRIGFVDEHWFYDASVNEYVMFTEENAEDYIGHQFVKMEGDSWTTNTLVSVDRVREVTTTYSPTTYNTVNFVVDDMLSMAADLKGLFNYFEVDPNTMAWIPEKKAADIKKYGLTTLNDFNGQIDQAAFDAFNVQYFNVSIGKGLMTWDTVQYYIDKYLPNLYMTEAPDGSNNTADNNTNILVDGEWNENNEQVLNTAKEAANKLHNAI